MFDLPHVASRVFGTPLMIARAKLEVILGVLAPRFAGGPIEVVDPQGDTPPLTSITVERIAVISVIGTLVSRSSYLDAASGLQAYGDIADAIAAVMDDASVRGVILDVDSPGGEVGGLFDLVEQIQAIRSASAKPLWAVANESALSAAYAIASATDRLYVNRRDVEPAFRCPDVSKVRDPSPVGSRSSKGAIEHVRATAEACRSPRSGGSRRRRGRALSPCCRINRSIRCSPQVTPSASRSCHTRLAP